MGHGQRRRRPGGGFYATTIEALRDAAVPGSCWWRRTATRRRIASGPPKLISAAVTLPQIGACSPHVEAVVLPTAATNTTCEALGGTGLPARDSRRSKTISRVGPPIGRRGGCRDRIKFIRPRGKHRSLGREARTIASRNRGRVSANSAQAREASFATRWCRGGPAVASEALADDTSSSLISACFRGSTRSAIARRIFFFPRSATLRGRVPPRANRVSRIRAPGASEAIDRDTGRRRRPRFAPPGGNRRTRLIPRDLFPRFRRD